MKIRLACLSIVAGAVCVFAETIPPPADDPEMPWDVARLSKPVEVRRFESMDRDGVKAIMITGEKFRGEETRVFAYYGLPEGASKDAKAPGMVLVHGGLGTAHYEWVKLWNSRGYAAIAMDNCGALPIASKDGEPFSRGGLGWLRHRYSGPIGWGAFERTNLDHWQDQWTYHAVAAVIRSHTFLRGLEEVDGSRIGITGISWGGYLTSIAASIDHRFAFAVPVYGCGRYDLCTLFTSYGRGDFRARRRWLKLWDPSRYLPQAKCPFMWVTGNRDFAYPLTAMAASADLVPTSVAYSVIPDMQHSQEHGSVPEEIRAFADHFCKGAPDAVRFDRPEPRDGKLYSRIHADGHAVVSYRFYYTVDPNPVVMERAWQSVDVAPAADGSVSAELPADALGAFFYAKTKAGVVFSSRPWAPARRAFTDEFVEKAREKYARLDLAKATKADTLAPAVEPARCTVADVKGLVGWVDLDGAFNVRDCGGWNGLATGRLYRGTELNETGRGHGIGLTANGVARALALGIRTDIDLRRPQEFGPKPNALGPTVKRVHCGVAPYCGCFGASTNGYARALRLLADAKNLPAYVHCWGGADRTGTLCWIVEVLCGASEVDAAIDYELTTFDWSHRDFGEGFGKPGARMSDVLAKMREFPGATLSDKVACYCERVLGLTSAEIAAIRGNLK